MTKCKSWNKDHWTVLENTDTGDSIPLDWCYDCILSQGYTYKSPESIDWNRVLQETEDKLIRGFEG